MQADERRPDRPACRGRHAAAGSSGGPGARRRGV